jgi:pimeloyl-ACP methyl ester carboxylesterase
MTLLRVVLWAGVGLAAAGVAIALSSFATAYLAVHPVPWSRYRRSWWTPSGGDGGARAVRFSSADGVGLVGRYLDRHAEATVVVCHGWPGNKDDMRGLAEALADAGFNVLAFDFRSWGESDASPVTLGYRETQDVLGAVAFARAQHAGRSRRIGIFGLSMGGAAARAAAARCPEIEAVVANSSYSRLDRAIAGVFQSLWGPAAPVFSVPTRWVGQRLIGTPLLAVAPVRAIERISPRPVLIIHGTRDWLVDVSEARTLYDAAGGPKELWLVEGADHGRTRRIAPGEYDRRVVGFFRQHLVGRA